MIMNKWFALVAVAAVLLTIVAVAVLFSFIVSTATPCIAEYEISGELLKDGADDGIFSLPVKGSDQIVQDLKDIKSNPSVASMLLVVNSPGGEVYPTTEIYAELSNFSKPIVVYYPQIGASGAYYLAMPAEHIMAHPDALVGNIGVRLDYMNVQGLFEKLGLNSTSYKSGKYKDMFSETRPVTEEEEAIIRSIVKDIFNDFKSVVQKHRGEKINDPEAYEAKIYTGRQAVSAGLVDSVGRKSDALDIAFDLAGMERSGRICSYVDKPNLGLAGMLSGAFYSLGKSIGQGIFDGIQLRSQQSDALKSART